MLCTSATQSSTKTYVENDALLSLMFVVVVDFVLLMQQAEEAAKAEKHHQAVMQVGPLFCCVCSLSVLTCFLSSVACVVQAVTGAERKLGEKLDTLSTEVRLVLCVCLHCVLYD